MSIYICWPGLQRTAERNSTLIKRWHVFIGPGTCQAPLPHSEWIVYYSRLTQLSISLRHVTKMMALSLKMGHCRSPVDIRHQGRARNARSPEARAVCLTSYALMCLADPGVELCIDCCRPENSVTTACFRADAAGDIVHLSTTCCQDLAKLVLQRGQRRRRAGLWLLFLPDPPLNQMLHGGF